MGILKLSCYSGFIHHFILKSMVFSLKIAILNMLLGYLTIKSSWGLRPKTYKASPAQDTMLAPAVLAQQERGCCSPITKNAVDLSIPIWEEGDFLWVQYLLQISHYFITRIIRWGSFIILASFFLALQFHLIWGFPLWGKTVAPIKIVNIQRRNLGAKIRQLDFETVKSDENCSTYEVWAVCPFIPYFRENGAFYRVKIYYKKSLFYPKK